MRKHLQYRFFVDRIMGGNAVEIHITRRDADGMVYCAKPVTFAKMDEEKIRPAAITFPDGFSDSNPTQHLLDALVNAGFKPGGFTQSAEDNLKKHLEDMRKIVSKKLGVALK